MRSVSITSLPFPLESPIAVGSHSVELVNREVKDVWPTGHKCGLVILPLNKACPGPQRVCLTGEYSLRRPRVRGQIVEEKADPCEPLGPVPVRIPIVRLATTPRQEEKRVGKAFLSRGQDISRIPRLENVPSPGAFFLLLVCHCGKVVSICFFLGLSV
jgi:hypothetical protein